MSRAIRDRWHDAVRAPLRATRGEDRGHLLAVDFPPGHSVRLGFPDGSYAFFPYAFCLCHNALREVAVFTEHCGYPFSPRRRAAGESARHGAFQGTRRGVT